MKKSAVNIPKVPNLRFPGFVGEWEVKRLGDVMDFKVTNSFSRENLSYELGTIKNIHYGDIHTKFQTLFDLTKENVPCINPEISVVKISEESFCQKGDIVFADASEDLNDVGKSIEIINLNGEKLLSGLHTLLARPKKNIFHLGFNGYLFKSNNIRIQIQRESQGSKVLSISTGRISKVELKYPNLSEQQKIASFLSIIDEKNLTQNKIIEALKTSIKAVSQTVFNDDKEQFTKAPLGSVCCIKKGEQINSSELSKSGSYAVMNGGTTPSGYHSNFNTEAGTISISEGGSCGYVQYNHSKFWSGGHCYTLTKPNSTILNKYLYYFLKFNEQHITSLRVGSGLPNIQKKDLEKFEIRFPNDEDQLEIVRILDLLTDKLEMEKSFLVLLTKQKQYLLKNLFI